jgi:hypothetical protein
MFEYLLNRKLKIVVVGDVFVSPETMAEAVNSRL